MEATTKQIKARSIQVGMELCEHGTVEGVIDHGDLLFVLTSHAGRDVFPADARVFQVIR